MESNRSQWRHDDRGGVIRWCFADVAATFASEFKE
jgi:hypothetical protein